MSRGALGSEGEARVCAHLAAQGFTIVAQNVRVGRLEIDVIARRGGLLVFCEVRSRSRSDFVDAIDTIDRAKQRRIRRAAELWLLRQRIDPDEIRFDAASVLISTAETKLDYYEDAF